MLEKADQIFILLKDWVVGFLPAAWQGFAGVVLGVIGIIAVFSGPVCVDDSAGACKGIGRTQNRIGPNRTGPFGILQPIADAIKSLTKEDVVPTTADRAVHFLAPVVLVVVVFMGFAVLPVGRNMVLVDIDASLLFYYAMGASGELSIFMAGWSSRNKYSLLGAMRAVAQMISYEVPLLLASVVIVMMTGSLSLVKIVEAQNQYTYGLPHWYIFTPWPLRRVCDLCHCGNRGDESLAVRFAGGRIGTGGRIFHGVFGIQVCAVLSGGVPGDVFGVGTGDDAVSGRVVGAVGGAGI